MNINDRIPLAILGAPSPYRQALFSVANPTRFVAVEPDDFVIWAMRPGPKALIVLVDGAVDWSTVESFTSMPDTQVVVLTPELALGQYTRALVSGCDGVVHSDTSAEIIMSVVEAALRGEVILPAEAARMMARQSRESSSTAALTPGETEVLKRLAAGSTIVALADEFGWSERTMRRRLHSVYLKLGASHRAGAIAKAGQLGILNS